MAIDFRNTNTVWASILTETLKRLGLNTALICPGSRSTPLALAFAQQRLIEAIPVLDERSAAFFALGVARATSHPVALICTSGTAGANFYPAVIEATESRVPLLILTADRPPELRNCHSGQTIDQLKLYGNYPNWQTELAVPSVEIGMLSYLRQTVVHAWERSLFPVPGPVHLNIPFREPLAPVPQLDIDTLPPIFQLEEFFAGITRRSLRQETGLMTKDQGQTIHKWRQCNQGMIIAGSAQPQSPRQYCEAVAQISQVLEWPVIAEGLSPVRNYAELNPDLISTYDIILRNRQLAQRLKPEMVIHLGELPISKNLQAWLDEYQPQRWVIDPDHHNLDPLHGKTIHLRISVEELGSWLKELGTKSWQLQKFKFASEYEKSLLPLQYSSLSYRQRWCEAQNRVKSAIDQKMVSMNRLFEGKAAWLLSQILPSGTPLFIANSMPVRDVECFWFPGNTGVQPWFNRGANGIDGTLSTALGIAHRNQSSVMLTGDLSLLHDTNGFLIRNKFVGHLTIILINNNGGGIFEMLPIAKFDPPFEEFFATPQNVNFSQLCLTYGVEYQLIESWEQLKQLLNPLPTQQGIRVLELPTDRKADARWRQEHLGKLAVDIGKV